MNSLHFYKCRGIFVPAWHGCRPAFLHRQLLVFVFLSAFGGELEAQSRAKAYQFLEVPSAARVASLGGNVAASFDADLNLVFHNPSLLTRDMRHEMVLNYVDYFAGINYGYAALATHAGKTGSVSGGIHYLNYGKFQGADENGLLTGTFRAADYSINFSYSRHLDSLFTAGITVKTIYSDLEYYKSSAIAFDAGISYSHAESKFAAALVLRNLGFQVSTYYPDAAREPLPFQISAGVMVGLQHAPLSFSIVADHLEKWDLSYKTEGDPEENNNTLTGEPVRASAFDRFADRMMRHVIIGAEFSAGENLVLRAGYNYRRRQELKVAEKPGMVGFSWGAAIRMSGFRISYGRGSFHLAGGVNYFSLNINLDELNNKFR